MATLLFYQELVALDRQEHRNLRLKKVGPDFAKGVNSVPLAGVEFFEAGRDLPVLFAKSANDDYVPLALLSLQSSGHNLGDWGDIYVPAFIRRYPFLKASDGNIVIDKQSPYLQEEEGDPLFKEDGSNSEFLDKLIGFLNHMDAQFKATAEYSDACAKKELFTPFNVQVNIGKEKPVRLDNLFVIDEKKLQQLSDEEAINWYRKGWLAWSYAHLHSLGAMRRVAMHDRKTAAEEETKDAART
jgi:hypothetical protein